MLFYFLSWLRSVLRMWRNRRCRTALLSKWHLHTYYSPICLSFLLVSAVAHVKLICRRSPGKHISAAIWNSKQWSKLGKQRRCRGHRWSAWITKSQKCLFNWQLGRHQWEHRRSSLEHSWQDWVDQRRAQTLTNFAMIHRYWDPRKLYKRTKWGRKATRSCVKRICQGNKLKECTCCWRPRAWIQEPWEASARWRKNWNWN